MTTGMNESVPIRPKEISGAFGRAESAVESTASDVKSATADLLGAAKDAASDAKDRIVEQAQEHMQGQKVAGADYLDGLAGSLDRLADEFDTSIPFAGQWMRTASQQMGGVAKTIREGDAQELARQAQDFARRQPTLCFGIAMAAGFGLVRMFKAAGSATSTNADTGAQRTS